MNKLKVKRLTETSLLPTRAHAVDAGLDLFSNSDFFIEVGSTVKIPIGVSIEVPPGYVGKIEDRSSLALKGLRTGGGIIDSGYSGEVCIVMHNISNIDSMLCPEIPWDKQSLGYDVKVGDKIAQLLLYKVETPDVEEVKEMNSFGRGELGFGSSGV